MAKVPLSGLQIDNPAYPLLVDLISYQGISDAAGAATGLTIVCGGLANEPSYGGHLVSLLSGDAAGQTRRVIQHVAGIGILRVDQPFTDNAGAVVQVTASTLFVVLSFYSGEATPLWVGTTTAAGQADGKTLIDTGLAVPFTVDDEPIGHTVRILTCTTASLVTQQRELYTYDFGTSVVYFDTAFTAQVPIDTIYAIYLGRPSGGGGGPSPEPTVEEVDWKLADKDIYDVADPTADTERWSSEYLNAAVADGTADINTSTASALMLNITSAAVALTLWGTRRLWPSYARKFFTLTDATVVVTNEDANPCWGGLAVSAGIAWDANNYIAIYKRMSDVLEDISVEYNLAGAGAVITIALPTTQTAVAFKIERIDTMWRCYYSLTQAPRHHWLLALEIEDPNNDMTDVTSIYNAVYNPEDAVGQEVEANYHLWEYYETLGNFGDILQKFDALVGATGIFHEQEDAGFSENITAAVTFIVTLNDANTRYILRDLRIKSADPTVANTITVRLYTLINSVEVNVDSFIITNANFTNYFSLMDMFGVSHVAGDSIRVSLQGSVAGPYVVTGQNSHAKTNV